ncbi:MAG: hypothetical protein ACKVOG_02245 [Rhodoglobus sp.]
MNRRLLSLVALPLALVGQVVIASAGTRAYRAVSETGQSPLSDPISLVVLVLGILVLAAAVATVGLSSLGVLIVGAVGVMLGLLALAVAPGSFGAPFRSLDFALASGIDLTFATGGPIVTGVTLVAGGLAARLARSGGGTAVRAIVAVAAVIAGGAGVVMSAIGGAGLARSLGAFVRGPAPVDVALVVGGALLLGIAAATLRWSTLGAGVLGGLLLVVGLWLLIAPAPVSAFFGNVALGLALSIPISTGVIAAIGAVFVALGLSTRWRRNRARAV